MVIFALGKQKTFRHHKEANLYKRIDRQVLSLAMTLHCWCTIKSYLIDVMATGSQDIQNG